MDGSSDGAAIGEEQDSGAEYYVIPEEAFELLPPEWQAECQRVIDDGKAVFKTIDKEMAHLIRITNSFPTLVALKHVQGRLSEYKFAATMDALLDLDMLTTAFVVTYARLFDGGVASGFGRDDLPPHLREVHDQIIVFRNKRYAHNAGHDSASNAMQIDFDGEGFHIKSELTLGYYVGGAKEWGELVVFLDELTYNKLAKLITRLKTKTGREWNFPSGPE